MQGSDGMPKIIEETKEDFNIISSGNNKPVLVKELAEIWFAHIENIMRSSSYARYHSHAIKYILPYIGDMEAVSFNKDILLSVLGFLKSEDCKEGSLSQYTIYIIEGMVRSMFRYGAENNLLPEIYFGKSEYAIVNKKDAMPLPGVELHNFICTVEKQDLETGKIHIHRNIVRIQHNMPSGSTGTGETATVLAECELPENMCRKFIMPEKLVSLLKEIESVKKPAAGSYVAEADKKAGRKRSITMPENAPDGRTLQYRLKSAGEKAGIKGLTFKMLRDTFAVMCLQAGGDVYSLAYVMGAGIPAVCDRYQQWMVKNDNFLKWIG